MSSVYARHLFDFISMVAKVSAFIYGGEGEHLFCSPDGIRLKCEVSTLPIDAGREMR